MSLFWSIIVFAIGALLIVAWLRGRKVAQQEEDVALGIIAPIAAEMSVGRLSPAQAEERIQEAAFVAPEAPALWKSMSEKQREELALNFMRLAINADFVANVEERLAPLKESDPELWEESMAKAKKALGRAPTEGQP